MKQKVKEQARPVFTTQFVCEDFIIVAIIEFSETKDTRLIDKLEKLMQLFLAMNFTINTIWPFILQGNFE